MIKLTFNDTTYELPESWDDLTFLQYIDLLNVSMDTMVSPTMAKIKNIVTLVDDSKGLEDIFMEIDNDDMAEIFEAFQWLYEEPKMKKTKKDTIKIDGVTYKLKADFNKLKNNEVIMIEELNASTKYDLHNLEIAFGVLVRELDEDGNEVPLTLDGLFNTILTLRDKAKMMDILPLVSSFTNGEVKSSSKASPSYSLTLTKGKTNTQSKKKKKTVKKT